MSDPIESAATEISLPKGIVLGKTGTSVLVTLAAYGAVSASRDAVSLSRKIHNNWKIKRAARKAETTTES